MFTIDMLSGESVPKRGDLLQTNMGDRRERTWMILRVRELKPSRGVPRAKLWAARWWELEPEMRMALYRSAERAGGQRVVYFKRYPQKKRKSFEELMRFIAGS